MTQLGLMKNDMLTVSDKPVSLNRQKRRDFRNSLLVSIALRIRREQGIRAAGEFLISWNVPAWVSARVLSKPGHTRQSDRLG
jgi:hypothetical protein